MRRLERTVATMATNFRTSLAAMDTNLRTSIAAMETRLTAEIREIRQDRRQVNWKNLLTKEKFFSWYK